jgi:hypothetical protein
MVGAVGEATVSGGWADATLERNNKTTSASFARTIPTPLFGDQAQKPDIILRYSLDRFAGLSHAIAFPYGNNLDLVWTYMEKSGAYR